MHASSDRNNPDAKIGFVIYYPFQFYVYKNVYEKLANKAEFIIDLGPFYPTPQTPDVLPAIVALLEKHGACYRILSDDLYVSKLSVERFLERYDTLVSVWSRGCVVVADNQKHLQVHMTYGAGKELTTFDLSKARFDLILAYGKYDDAFYSQIAHSVIVGNPKFDDWFAEAVDDTSIASTVARLDTKKKTVLYLPTHSDLSSVDEIAPMLGTLRDKYNVIVKLHYYTAREEPARVTALSDSGAIICGDDTDLLPLLACADVVVSDNSSAIFDAMLAGKSLIVTDFHDADFFDTAHQKIREYRRGSARALTYSGSIEQRIKCDGTVMTITAAADLEQAIARILENDDTREKCNALAERLFSYRDGRSGERAAAAIEEARADERKAKPFLYHALAHYTAHTLRRPFLNVTRSETLPLEASKLLACSVILFHEPLTSALALKRSVRALVEQEGDVEIGIFIVTQDEEALEKAGVAATILNRGDRVCVHIHAIQRGETLGTSLTRLMSSIQHDIVFFTTTLCAVRSRWILTLAREFTTHPEIGGVGGFARIHFKASSTVERFLTHERHRQLGIEGEQDPYVSSVMLITQIFNQTPAGDVRSIAYRREFLKVLPAWIVSLAQLEAYLKIFVLLQKPLAFVMMPTFLFEPRTLREAMRESYGRALAHGMARDVIRTRWVYRAVSLYSVARVCIRYVLRGKLRLAGIALSVGMAKWWGSTRARFGLMYLRIRQFQRWSR